MKELPKERNLIEIMNDLLPHTDYAGVIPLIMEYQKLMGKYNQNKYKTLGEMYKRYMPQEEYKK